MIENNATVMKVEQLPDCLFRIWIKPDWDVSSIDWLAGQFLRLGIIEEGFGPVLKIHLKIVFRKVGRARRCPFKSI